MTITFDENGVYTETVEGWTITARSYSPNEVEIKGPPTGRRGVQEASIDRDGDLCLDVTDGERGRGWDGDCASDRYIPARVVVAAFRVWEAARKA